MKHLLACLLLVMAALAVQAQETEEEQEGYVYEPYFENKNDVYTRVAITRPGVAGLKGYGNAGRITSYSFGIGYTHVLTYKGDVNVNAEINYARQGFRLSGLSHPDDIKELVINYIQIPVIVRYYPFQEFKFAYVGAGPQISFKSGEVEFTTQSGNQYYLMDQEVNSPDLSLVGVAGVHFAKKLDMGLELRYQHGLNKFLNPLPEARHSVFQLSFFFPAEAIMQFGLYFPIF